MDFHPKEIDLAMISDKRPRVYDYTSFREFLKDSYLFKRKKNPSFTESAFVKQIGLGANSRGYLKLIIQGKRNLTNRTMHGIINCLKFTPKESHYFETLVYYNQAKNDEEKEFYFKRLEQSIGGRHSSAFLVLKSQYNYYSKWYLVAIREVVALKDFVEDEDWIRAKLKNKVTKKQVSDSILDLLNLGLLKRRDDGKLVQSATLVKFSDDETNYTVVQNVHSQFLDCSKEALHEESYNDRSVSHVVISTDESRFKEMREDIKEFRDMINRKYGDCAENKINKVYTLGIQLYPLTN